MANGRVALVTGAGSGIGRATAHRLATDGYAVIAADVVDTTAQRCVDEIRDAGGAAHFVQCDVRSPDSCHAAVQHALKTFGALHVLVANAGIQRGARLEDTSPEDWGAVLDVNLNGVAHCARAALAVMERDAALVFVSSVNALRGSADMAAYDAAKSAVLALMRTLAVAEGKRGIRVNAVCPGNTLTEPHLQAAAARGLSAADIRAAMADYGALGRAAEPAEIAAAISFLSGPDASFISGHALVVDGGATMMLR